MVHPIMDQYYDRNPQHRRSTAFVRTKGLSANEKGTSRAGTPFGLPAGIPAVSAAPQLPDHPEPLKQRLRGPTIPSIPVPRVLDTFSSTSTLPRSRTPLSHSETVSPEPSSLQTPSTDVRALTAPPLLRATSQQPPAQGNIKKKRASLSAVEAVHAGGSAGLVQYFDTSPITPEPARAEYGTPDKIARMFPELALQ